MMSLLSVSADPLAWVEFAKTGPDAVTKVLYSPGSPFLLPSGTLGTAKGQMPLAIIDEDLLVCLDGSHQPYANAMGLKAINDKIRLGAVGTSMVDMARQSVKQRLAALGILVGVFFPEILDFLGIKVLDTRR
jgi:hypothetical protein